MIRVGLIRNPKSRRNRNSDPPLPRTSGSLEMLVAAPSSPEELLEALTGFADQEVGTIVIDGGDGTIREVMTALPQAFKGELPKLALLAAGKTNVIARDVGSPGLGPRALDRLLQTLEAGTSQEKSCTRASIEVSWADGLRPPMRGMFFGAAGFVLGTELSERAHRRGLSHGPAVAATILFALREVSGRDSSARWRGGVPMTLEIDGEVSDGNRFLVLATTLERLMLSIWPFWGGGEKSIRFLDVPANPPPLRSFALPLLRGRPTTRMLESGFRSATAETIGLDMASRFILDGEIFESGAGGIRLSAGPVFRFLTP